MKLSTFATVALTAFAVASVPQDATAALYATATQEGTSTSGDATWGNVADYVAGDLTTLGSTDWAMFGASAGAPVIVNSKAGGTVLTAPTSNRSAYIGNANREVRDFASAVAHFTYTDGESPASATNADGGAGMGARRDQNWAGVPLPRFELTIPVGSAESTLYLWTVVSEGTIRIEALNGATSLGGINYSAGNSAGQLTKLVFGGADTPSNLTIRVHLTAGSQDGSYLGLSAAALSAVPEPGSLAVLGIALPALLRRRRV